MHILTPDPDCSHPSDSFSSRLSVKYLEFFAPVSCNKAHRETF